MRKIAFIAAVAAGVVATPAAAQSGAWVAAIVGQDEIEFSTEDYNTDESDLLYGVGAGYDFAVTPGVFVGVEVEYSESEAEVSDTDGGITAGFEADGDIYAGIRVGANVGNTVAVYAKGGYTSVSLNAFATDGVDVLEADESYGGFRIGAGVEAAIGGNFLVRAEYRYSDYGEIASFEELGTLDFNRSQFVAGVGFKF